MVDFFGPFSLKKIGGQNPPKIHVKIQIGFGSFAAKIHTAAHFAARNKGPENRKKNEVKLRSPLSPPEALYDVGVRLLPLKHMISRDLDWMLTGF